MKHVRNTCEEVLRFTRNKHKRRRGLQKFGGARSCNFATDKTANFPQRRLWMLKIPILPICFPKMGGFNSKFRTIFG